MAEHVPEHRTEAQVDEQARGRRDQEIPVRHSTAKDMVVNLIISIPNSLSVVKSLDWLILYNLAKIATF
jgi:hypothetical protein